MAIRSFAKMCDAVLAEKMDLLFCCVAACFIFFLGGGGKGWSRIARRQRGAGHSIHLIKYSVVQSKGVGGG